MSFFATLLICASATINQNTGLFDVFGIFERWTGPPNFQAMAYIHVVFWQPPPPPVVFTIEAFAPGGGRLVVCGPTPLAIGPTGAADASVNLAFGVPGPGPYVFELFVNGVPSAGYRVMF